MIGIYKYTSPSGKVYIGSSINIPSRIKHYKTLDCKGQRKLYNSFLKYGYINHLFEIVEECDIKLLYERERYYGELYNVLGQDKGLNLSLPKTDEYKTAISEETRAKMSNRQKGEKNNFYGMVHSEEVKKKIAKANTGRIHTEEHKNKVSMNHAKAMSKLIIDLETGIFYNSIKEASIAKDMNHSTLKSRINGSSRTKTLLTYA